MQNLSVDLSVNQVYRSKRKEKDLINGDEQLQYGVLRDYAQMINIVDKGSRVILKTEMADETSQPKFKRMYVRFNAQKIGFLGRPKELQLVFISDRQKILCETHLQQFKVDHKGLELKDALWRCVVATTVGEFERCMQYIKDLDEKAYDYLANIAPTQWTMSHFTPRALTDCLVNNLSESFNLMILKSREKPILAMLEWIRVRLMTRLYIKREGLQKYARKLCPNIQDKLEKLKVESKPFSATPAGSFLYEVASQYERHVVDLVKKTCNCRYCDLNGIPCKHARTTIYTNIETLETYTHPCYHKETYMETYKEVLPAMPGQSKWTETGQPAPVAPHIYKPPGRPPKQRKRAPDEPRNPYKASRLNKAAREGVPAPSTRSGSAPQAAPQPPPQQPTQTYNMRSATQPSSTQQGNQASQQGNQARPSHMRAGSFSSSQPEFHTPKETWDTLPSSSQVTVWNIICSNQIIWNLFIAATNCVQVDFFSTECMEVVIVEWLLWYAQVIDN
ncbi:hypothetical protein SO802_026559 [Lithocarpus litseifolius]|uniref:SWIM-type domain-containing protein n=1 Tax=Lithocarpus litseifolius TaxID=425828 RepID=A0AAW2C378_9ROSI